MISFFTLTNRGRSCQLAEPWTGPVLILLPLLWQWVCGTRGMPVPLQGSTLVPRRSLPIGTKTVCKPQPFLSFVEVNFSAAWASGPRTCCLLGVSETMLVLEVVQLYPRSGPGVSWGFCTWIDLPVVAQLPSWRSLLEPLHLQIMPSSSSLEPSHIQMMCWARKLVIFRLYLHCHL